MQKAQKPKKQTKNTHMSAADCAKSLRRRRRIAWLPQRKQLTVRVDGWSRLMATEATEATEAAAPDVIVDY